MPENGETFSLDGVPPERLGEALSRWMRAIDRAFVGADDADKIHGHLAALSSTMRLLQRLPGFDADAVALRDLLARLDKLSVGQKKPILAIVEAVKTPGRAPASFLDHVSESRAVAHVHCAMSRGWTEADACKLVAQELARIGVKGRRGEALTGRAVQGWLSKIKASDPVYRMGMDTFTAYAPPTMTSADMRKLVRMLVERGKNLRD